MSSGTPSEIGLNLDADAVLDFAMKHPKINKDKLVLFGRSLGGAVAISLGNRNQGKVAAIVVENTFLSIADMVDSLMPWARRVKHFILRINWDNYHKIQIITSPIYFIASELDEIVPATHMKKLYEAAAKSSHKEFYHVIGGTHNDAFEVAGEKYYDVGKFVL